MSELEKEIALEIKQRDWRLKLPLDETQYKLLRLQGKSREEVQEFETKLNLEIRKKDTDPVFISSLWIEYRVKGYEPNQIEYDWVHAVR